MTTADGVSQLYGEVVRWDSTNKQAYLWVKVPSLSASVDTTLYLYFDNAHSDNTAYIGLTGSSAAQNVWDSNFVAVYHQAEQGAGSSGEYKDSTSHHNNGTSTGPLAPVRVTDSPNGFAQQFDGPSANWSGHDRLITIPDSNDFSLPTTGKLTLSYWIKPTAWNMPGNDNIPPQSGEGRLGIMGKCAPGNDEWLINLHNNAAVAGQYWDTFYNFNLGGSYGAGSKIDLGSSTTTWHYSVSHALWTGSASTSYNDQYKGDPAPWSDSHREPFTVFNGIAPGNGPAPVEIGGMTHYSGSGHDYFTGLFAEIRFSNIQRSDAWGRADYYAQSDALITYGTVSSQGISTPTVTPTPTPTPTPTVTPTPTPTPISGSTFGLNSGTDAWSDTGSVLNAMRFQNNAGSGNLTKMELLYSTSAPVGKVRLGVYADNNGRPGARLLDAGETYLTNGWVTIGNLNLAVTANTYYWLAYEMQSGNSVVYQSGQVAGSHYWVNQSYGTLPASYPVSGLSTNNSPYVMYATVTRY